MWNKNAPPRDLISGVEATIGAGAGWNDSDKWVQTEEGLGTKGTVDGNWWDFDFYHIQDLGNTTQSFTHYMRFRYDTLVSGDQQRPCMNGYDTDTGPGGTWWGWGFELDGTLEYQADDGATAQRLDSDAWTPRIGWNSGAGVMDRENGRFKKWTNGFFSVDDAAPAASVEVTNDGTTGRGFGMLDRPHTGLDAESFINGLITVVYVFDRALSSAELLLLDADPYALIRPKRGGAGRPDKVYNKFSTDSVGVLDITTLLEPAVRPVSDVSGAGWDTAPSASQDLFAQLDEETPSDTDYIFSEDA
jgi:hypothetical protein